MPNVLIYYDYQYQKRQKSTSKSWYVFGTGQKFGCYDPCLVVKMGFSIRLVFDSHSKFVIFKSIVKDSLYKKSGTRMLYDPKKAVSNHVLNFSFCCERCQDVCLPCLILHAFNNIVNADVFCDALCHLWQLPPMQHSWYRLAHIWKMLGHCLG